MRPNSKTAKKRLSLRLEMLEARNLFAGDSEFCEVVDGTSLTPFDATSSELYQFHGFGPQKGQLSSIDLSENAFTNIGDAAGFNINAAGYRSADNFIYAINQSSDHLLRVGAGAEIESLGNVSGLPGSGNYYTGDFGPEGLLYVRDKNVFYGINVDTRSVERTITTSEDVKKTYDIAFDPASELVYSIRRNGRKSELISIDLRDGPAAGVVDVIDADFTPSGVYGGLFLDSNGRLFASHNSGGLYEIDKSTGDATFAGETPPASSNDGAANSSVAVNLPPVVEDVYFSAAVGQTATELEIPTPYDLEGETITVEVTVLPEAGSVATSAGSVVAIGDLLTPAELAGLIYTAPEVWDLNDSPGVIQYEAHDGNSVAVGNVDIVLDDSSRIVGQVVVDGGEQFGVFQGLAFNNDVILEGVSALGDAVYLTTKTDFFGQFVFEDVLSGTYTLTQVQPPQVLSSHVTTGDLDGVVADNSISEFEISGSQEFRGIEFVEYAPSYVHGFVYLDDDFNGQLDSRDTVVQSAVITLTGINDLGESVEKKTISDFAGFYSFGGLRPGEYQVQRIASGGYSLDANDDVITVSLGAAEDSAHNDFGLVESNSLSGVSFLDNDLDKVYDGGDTPLAAVVVTLDGQDHLGNAIFETTVTDENGHYQFLNLPAGQYSISQTQPEGLEDGRANVGTFLGRAASIDRNGVVSSNLFENIELTTGEHGRGYDFGERVEYVLAESFDEVYTFTGTAGDDDFSFVAGDTHHVVTLNGVEILVSALDVVEINFDGLDGEDNVVLVGSDLVEQTHLYRHRGKLHSGRYLVSVESSESIDVENGEGFDRAFLFDTVGDDVAKLTESYVRITGDDFFNQANGFHRTYAYSREGGEDRAYFHDSKKDDTFKGAGQDARMFSRRYYNRAEGFERIYAFANSGGHDTLRLWDTEADNDTLEARPTESRIYNDDYYIFGEGFETVNVSATEGGENDRAHLYDSSGDEIFVSSPQTSGITGRDFSYEVTDFERVYATASEGNDRAFLYDSPLDDRFVAYPDHSKLYNDDFYVKATEFDRVQAFSSGGTGDRAYFHDSAGRDYLVAMQNDVRMVGYGFDNSSHGFARAYGYSAAGGDDYALLRDSSLADTLVLANESAKLYGEGHYTKLDGFERVDTVFTEYSDHDRAMIFGSVESETLRAAGDLARVIGEFGAAYIYDVDGLMTFGDLIGEVEDDEE